MTDDRLEQSIGTLLRAGVLLAAAVVLIGGVWHLAANGGGSPDYRHFRPAVGGVRSSFGKLPLAERVIELGLLLLIATPIARVIFALVGFALERDRLYVAITLAVLVILLGSIGTAWL